ncbi:MAG: nicotinate-nucleotide adenylyltransferase [Rhodothalassiaceae bacterium]
MSRCRYPVRPIRGRPGAPATPTLLAGVRIGLLGGSFNPAHDGHLHISLQALKRLDLDFVWWMVSPQNPLKSTQGMAPFALRFASAQLAALHPRILVSDIETRIFTRYTADTLCHLRVLFPRTQFVWLMGADNLQQFHRWQRWHEIMKTVPIAVFDRPAYSRGALRSKMPQTYRRHRCSEREWRSFATSSLPAWTFITCPRHPASATQIRAVQPFGHADIFLEKE